MAIKNSVRLECKNCKEINYLTRRNKKKNLEKLILNKFCSRCRKSTEHTETKKK